MRRWIPALVLCLSSLAPLAEAAVPSPANSSVAPCLIVCPQGDVPFVVVVRDFAANPVANSTVVIDFNSCPTVTLCPSRPSDPYTIVGSQVIAVTNAQGRVEFPIRAGGVCGTPSTIRADGVQLATRPTASFDQDGNLLVDPADLTIVGNKVGTSDPTADFDCDGTVTEADVSSLVFGHAGDRCVGQFVGIPDPSLCRFDPCLVVCPLGDHHFRGEVRDAFNNLMVGSLVALEFQSCPDVALCPQGPDDPYFVNGRTVIAITDAQGRVDFPLRAGGICAGSVFVRADGVPIASRHVASYDQNGNLLVDAVDLAIVQTKLGTFDPTADFDCNFVVDVLDLARERAHDGHACERPVPARPTSWGRVKAIYR